MTPLDITENGQELDNVEGDTGSKGAFRGLNMNGTENWDRPV
jgi:hypothetical protein